MPPVASEPQALRGRVKELNFAPKGEIDGLLIEADGRVTQVNLGPDHAGRARGLVGQDVEVRVGHEPKVDDHPRGDHPVFKLVAFADEDGTAEHKTQGHKPPEHKPHGHKPHPHPEPAEVTGTVRRLNYAKHGEANGVVLDTGDFVHLKPDGMKLLGLAVGQGVTASGPALAGESGGKVVEAEVVNGIKVHPKKHG